MASSMLTRWMTEAAPTPERRKNHLTGIDMLLKQMVHAYLKIKGSVLLPFLYVERMVLLNGKEVRYI